MKQNCISCHFLSKEFVDNSGRRLRFSWNDDDRRNLELKDPYSASCSRGVWDTGISPALNFSLEEVLKQDRKNDCFFVEKHDGMSFEAAFELFRIRDSNRQLKRNYRYTQIGLGVAAIGIVANVILSIVKLIIEAD